MLIRARVILTVALLTAGAAIAAGCGGGDSSTTTAPAQTTTQAASEQPSQRQAEMQVCDARDRIAREVEDLAKAVRRSGSPEQIRSSIAAIQTNLQTIGDARHALSDARRAQVDAANSEFAAALRHAATTVLQSGSPQEAITQARAAADELGATYRTTFGALDCS
jgi:hypothetical protein